MNLTGLYTTRSGNKAHIRRGHSFATLCGKPLSNLADTEQVRANPHLICQKCIRSERAAAR